MDKFRGKNKNVAFVIVAALIAPALSIQSRSVNLALETSFLFDPQDMKENATFINKMQNVLDKIKTVLEPTRPVFRAMDDNKEREKVYLTKFLSQIGSYLIKFDNNDVKKFTSDLRDAVNKLANDKEYNELVVDEKLRAFIKNTVALWAVTDPMVLKVEIAKFITSMDTDAVIELFKIFNKVFDAPDELKFKKLAKKFSKANKNNDYTKFLSKTIDFVVFKRYKKLNFLLKHIIADELKKFTEYVSEDFKDRVVEVNNTRRYSLASVARSVRLAEKEISESNEKNTLKSKAEEDEKKNEDIVIDKDLNVSVRTDDKDGLVLKFN